MRGVGVCREKMNRFFFFFFFSFASSAANSYCTVKETL